VTPLLLLAIVGPGGQAQTPAPPAAAEVPATSSPGLAAAFPDIAAIPGVVLVGYPVHGRSPRAIRESMNAARPSDPAGDPFDAVTRWRYSARWRNNGEGVCDPATVEVTLQVTITLPELTNREQLSSRERADWDHYLTVLAAHEHNHLRIALTGAEQMRTFMRAAPDCDTMRAVRARVGDAVRDANNTYDANTRHGGSEGVRYP